MSAPLRTPAQLRADAARYDRIAELYAQDIAVLSGRAKYQRDQRNFKTADQLDSQVHRLVIEEQTALFEATSLRIAAARLEGADAQAKALFAVVNPTQQKAA